MDFYSAMPLAGDAAWTRRGRDFQRAVTWVKAGIGAECHVMGRDFENLGFRSDLFLAAVSMLWRKLTMQTMS